MRLGLDQCKCPALLIAVRERYGGVVRKLSGHDMSWASARDLQMVLPVLLQHLQIKHVKLACILHFAAGVSVRRCAFCAELTSSPA